MNQHLLYERIQEINDRYRIVNGLNAEANAKLCAAAPELLEALEEITRVMRANPQTAAITVLDAVEGCEAAIKKAKGE